MLASGGKVHDAHVRQLGHDTDVGQHLRVLPQHLLRQIVPPDLDLVRGFGGRHFCERRVSSGPHVRAEAEVQDDRWTREAP